MLLEDLVFGGLQYCLWIIEENFIVPDKVFWK